MTVAFRPGMEMLVVGARSGLVNWRRMGSSLRAQ